MMIYYTLPSYKSCTLVLDPGLQPFSTKPDFLVLTSMVF